MKNLFIILLLSFNSYLIAYNCYYCKTEIDNSYVKYKFKNYHQKCYDNHIAIKCFLCKKKIEGEYMQSNSKPCHKHCYNKHLSSKCDFCNLLIKSDDVYYNKDKKKYHDKCYKENILIKCSICKSSITGKYMVDSWDNNYHNSHSNKNCSSCGRIVSPNTSNGGIKVSENRTICGFCISSTVQTNNEIEDARNSVVLLLKEVGFLKIPDEVPIQIVDKNKICNLTDKNNCKYHQGLTHYEYTYDSKTGKKISEGENSIYILDNLHILDFESTLAHEYLHVWLNINDVKYSDSIIEGFCNLGSALVYKKNPSHFSKLKLEGMFDNDHPDYGLGFVKMNSCLELYGWEVLINNMKNNINLQCF